MMWLWTMKALAKQAQRERDEAPAGERRLRFIRRRS
jgi:hypothetical protein